VVGVSVRRGRPDDVDAACAIAVQAFEPVFEYRRDRLGEACFEQLFCNWRLEKEHQIRRFCNENMSQFVVAEVDDDAAGFGTYQFQEEQSLGIIDNNAVSPKFQGRGVGVAIQRHILNEFRERGLLYAQVTTGLDPAHAPARNVYSKMGFRQSYDFAVFHLEL
jgi:GNAT superfamily N-acetyltransferase